MNPDTSGDVPLPEVAHPTASDGTLGRGLYLWPVAINAALQFIFQTLIVVYDGGAIQTAAFYFSIPYWVGAVFIGIRRWQHPTIGDANFLIFGQIASITILFILRPEPAYP